MLQKPLDFVFCGVRMRGVLQQPLQRLPPRVGRVVDVLARPLAQGMMYWRVRLRKAGDKLVEGFDDSGHLGVGVGLVVR